MPESRDHWRSVQQDQPDLKAKYKEIPWREMSDIRNKIIHHYFGVDYEIVWDTIITDIPALHQYLLSILNETNN